MGRATSARRHCRGGGRTARIELAEVGVPIGELNGPSGMIHCEDAVAVADQTLRAAIAERHPGVWARMLARRRFMRERPGTDAADEVLPLDDGCAHLPPFWLRPGLAFVCVG